MSILGLLGITFVTGNLIGSTLILFGLLILWFEFGGSFQIIGNGLWNVLNSFALTALPMFIFMGELLAKSGISHRIYGAIAPLFGRIPGQLVQTNIGACTMFSAICGSSQATAAVVGAIAFDELKKQDYSPRWIAGSIAAGGTLGILIPPSIALIIYGWWQEVSIGRLFIGGILPGLMIAGLFMVFIGIVACIRPQDFPSSREKIPLLNALRMSIAVWPFVILVLAIIGTIALGIATPTESAALGVLATVLLSISYRSFSLRMIWSALLETIKIMSTIGLVIIGATVLSQALALSGLPEQIAGKVANSSASPLLILLGIYALYLVLGCMLAAIEMLLITLPFTFPIVTALGYDPVWFGIVVVMLIEVGMLTPPVGMNLFVIVAASHGTMSLGEVARACIPFWFLLLASIAIVTIFPSIVLFLPNLLF